MGCASYFGRVATVLILKIRHIAFFDPVISDLVIREAKHFMGAKVARPKMQSYNAIRNLIAEKLQGFHGAPISHSDTRLLPPSLPPSLLLSLFLCSSLPLPPVPSQPFPFLQLLFRLRLPETTSVLQYVEVGGSGWQWVRPTN